MTDMKFYYYDSSFYVAVVSDIFMAFDFHDAVPAEFYRDFPREKVASFRKKYFFTSHIHADHFEPTVFKYAGEGVKFILDEAIPAEESERILRVKKGDTYTDEDLTVHVFGSTDEGVSFGVEVAGKKIFHAGDLNLWHWRSESTLKEIEEAEQVNPTKLVVCKKRHEIREMDNEEAALERIELLIDHYKAAGLEVEILDE